MDQIHSPCWKSKKKKEDKHSTGDATKVESCLFIIVIIIIIIIIIITIIIIIITIIIIIIIIIITIIRRRNLDVEDRDLEIEKGQAGLP